MVEYVLVLAALTIVASALWWFASCARRYAHRAENLVTMDCP